MAGTDAPATLGGPTWQQRTRPHAADVAGDSIWRRCGYRSEWARLESVMLARPPDSLAAVTDPDRALMMRRVDLGRIRLQYDVLCELLRGRGIEVLLDDQTGCPLPNVIFQRDLYLVTPHGAVVARTASPQRAGEERRAASALALAGIPILTTVHGAATFEGADALWLAEDTVAVAVGFRTNPAGAAAVATIFAEQGVRTETVPLGPGVQHLLGSVQVIDERTALVRPSALAEESVALLRRLDYRLVEVGDEVCEENGGIGLLTLGPREVVVSRHSTLLRRLLDAHDVEAVAVDTTEFLAAAGGLGCLTGILRRADR